MVGAWLDVDTKRTLPNWFNMHQDLCIDWKQANPKQIAGPGHIVQIDESAVSSAKAAANGRARQFRQRWVFGDGARVSYSQKCSGFRTIHQFAVQAYLAPLLITDRGETFSISINAYKYLVYKSCFLHFNPRVLHSAQIKE